MGTDPYARKDGFIKNPYHSKRRIEGELVVVLQGTLPDRGLELIKPKSRALLKGEIHELILTDEQEAGPGSTVNNIAYLGFVEIQVGSVVLVGDPLIINGVQVGTIAGFDEVHMPNHINIVVKGSALKDGCQYLFQVGDTLRLG